MLIVLWEYLDLSDDVGSSVCQPKVRVMMLMVLDSLSTSVVCL